MPAALGQAPRCASQPLAQPCLAGRQVPRSPFCRQGTRWRWMASCSLRLVAIAIFQGLRVCQACFAFRLRAVLGTVFYPSRASAWLLLMVCLQARLRQARSSVCSAAELLRRWRCRVWSGAGASCPWVAEEICAQHLAGSVQMGGADHRPNNAPRVLGNFSACARERFLSASWGCHAKPIADVSRE